MLGEARRHFRYHDVHDLSYLRFAEGVEHDGFVYAVEELGSEDALEGVVYRRTAAGGVILASRSAQEAYGLAVRGIRAQVAGHYHQGIAEVHGTSVPVGEASVFEDLQQRVEHVGVRLLYLVEQDDAEWTAADGLGQLSALVVANVSGRRAYEPRHGVSFHEFGHIYADQVLLVVEQEPCQRARQLGLAHAGRAEEDEAADGTLGVFESGAGAAHGIGDGGDGGVLSDDALMQPLLHPKQLIRLGFQQPVNGDAGPGCDQPADLLRGYSHGRSVALAFTERIPLLFEVQAFGAVERRLLVVGALRGSPLLVFEALDARLQPHDLRRRSLRLDSELGGGFVYQVNRLVGQQPVGYVALAQPDGGLDGGVFDLDLVVGFVLGTQALEHLDGDFRLRLFDQHGLEASFESGVALDVAAVLVLCRRADGLQFAAREGGLHHVRGV